MNRFVTGIEFREGGLVINDRCAHLVKKNMTFVVALGLQNFPNETAKEDDKKVASIFLSDTVLISEVKYSSSPKRAYLNLKINLNLDDLN
jgi:nucleosome binding factor SPN SPT16 subunit